MRVPRIAHLRSARILAAASEVLALPFPPPLDEAGHLVFLVGLPRQPHRRTADVGIEVRIDHLPIGRDDLHRRVGDDFVRRLMPRRQNEPELIFLDGSAERAGKHVNVLDGVSARNAARSGFQLGVGVVGLPLAAAEPEERGAGEHVAAILQHAVHPNPAAGGVGRNRAGHDRDFRLQHVVKVGLRGAFETLNRHAFHELLGVVAGETMRA